MSVYEGKTQESKVLTYLKRNRLASTGQLGFILWGPPADYGFANKYHREYVPKVISKLRKQGHDIRFAGKNTNNNSLYRLVQPL